MENIQEIGKRVADKLNLKPLYIGLAGSQQYGLANPHDLDILIITDSEEQVAQIARDLDTGAHVFIRSITHLRNLIDGKIEPYFHFSALTSLDKEKSKIIGIDFFDPKTNEQLKKVIAEGIRKTCCSPDLVKLVGDSFVPTRQSKGLYHALAFMYKVENHSFNLTKEQIEKMNAAHDRVLDENTIDEIYEFYGLNREEVEE